MPTMAEIASDRAVDPDAQAAVTDFLDYTEYLPSDLIRSLTLIRGLDDTYLNNSLVLHNLTKLYGSLPNLAPPSRPNAQELRGQISTSLDQALNARESAYAEACRMFDVVDRHQNRLKSIIAKLNAIPKPPSRDPTPQPTPSTQVKRSRSGRKIDAGASTRLTLHPPRGNAVASAILKRPRGRRVTVPGDVMPPFDPDSPIASTEVSDWESPPPSPPRPVLKLKQPKPSAPPKNSKQRPPPLDEKTRESREATEPYHKPTPPPEDAEIGSKWRPWTHLTEFEMYKLRKKMKKNHAWEPSDVMIRRELADRGRGWDNYYRAKAEAQANGTRFIDIDSIEKLTPKAERPDKPENLDQVESVEKPDTSETVGKVEEVDVPAPAPAPEPEALEKSEESAAAATVATTAATTAAASGTPAPKSKSSKKNEKKEKKPDPARSQAALAAQEAELAARRLGDIGSKFRTLFTTPFTSALASLSRSASTPIANRPTTTGKKGTEKTSKKRKAEDTPTSSVSPSAEPEAARKKQKIAPKPSPLAASPIPVAAPTSPAATSSEPPPSISTGSIKIPLKLNVAAAVAAPTPGVASASASKTPTPAPTTRAASVQRSSVAPKPEGTPPASTATSSRPPSRRSGAASVEPQLSAARSSRRASMTPSLAGGQKTPAEKEAQGPSPKAIATVPTAASHRSKRDAPGMVTQSSQDGGAAVSVSKRKTKPAKKTSSTAQIPQIRIDVDGRQEIVDPDEERYCLCGDVSWGEMICCEMDEKCDYGQWFHMECVSLVELPPRTVKWYCPGDRKKYHKGETTNGLVGRGIK
ncbi:uncharacterized protein PV07_09912 [Cladophialophora immunda]|uniref:Inhibitor of growth protein N-terminal histone-binding domain-containing protein n=1 Tax=Cladophialophora immunda TaxID=569365 RepID=A0A0D2AH35_9EURO|nr:uncharacterized protein PV07_09912 [Cladophialophora immunda]KIW24182.1 hypothetical protein PV07_09912 [Cladophialophora immunda]OQV05334.1 hypothetical protein CLAIMM_10094 [Cladophialophora immunda]